MQAFMSEISGKVFRAKCPHGCPHAGEGVLFKFSKGKGLPTAVDVLEIGLDHRDNLLANCVARMGSSNNWLLLTVKNEPNPYTYAVHRLPGGKFEIYISGTDSAEQFPLDEVDSRYEDVSYYVNRPSRKRSRHRSRSYSHHRSRSSSKRDESSESYSDDS